MNEYRVTKYDPAHRDKRGRYLRDDWTSMSDIATTPTSCAEYALVEDAYVAALCAFYEQAGAPSLAVLDLEARDKPAAPAAYLDDTRHRLAHVRRDRVNDRADLEQVIRLALREAIWCRLEQRPALFIHFGYDYYAYVGGAQLGVPDALPPQIFVERYASPHHPEAGEDT